MHDHSEASAALREAVRAALRPVPLPVTVALVHDGQEVRGATVTSFMPVSLDPPLLAIAIGAGRWLHAPLAVGGVVGISVLGAGSEHVADHFSSRPDRAGGVVPVRTQRTPGGAPVIAGSIAAFECVVEALHAAGDHTLVLARARVAIAQEDDANDPLLWCDGRYTYVERA